MKKFYALSVATVISLAIASCGGSSAPSQSSGTPTTAAKPSGSDIYNRTCVACHQANGEGLPGTFPPLAKSDFITDKNKTISQVLKGYSGELVVNGKKFNNTMPPQQLTDDEIASVLTYVYSNFGNSGSPVTADEVKAVRAK